MELASTAADEGSKENYNTMTVKRNVGKAVTTTESTTRSVVNT